MSIDLVRILVDFGLLILIWMVQAIIYPSFQYADAKQFVGWHHSYASRISYFVIPLMFGQVGLYIYTLVTDFQPFYLVSSVLIGVAWLMTFIWMVPLHGQLGRALEVDKVKKLVNLNWIRTACWSLVFGLNLIVTAINI